MCVKYTLSIEVPFDFFEKIPLSRKIYTSAATDAIDKYEVFSTMDEILMSLTEVCVDYLE